MNGRHELTLLNGKPDNNRQVEANRYYFAMNPLEQLQEALEAIEWIHGAGKTRRELMFADKVEKDYADEQVSVWFLGAVFNELGNIESEMLINDLQTLFVNELSIEDEDWRHPEIFLPMGTAISIIANIEYVSPRSKCLSDKNPGVRVAVASSTNNPEILSILSADPCMIVRTIVALNVFTPEKIKLELREDRFFDVRRRTLYGDRDAIREFDEIRRAINAGEIEIPDDDAWPGDCPCRQDN